MARRSLPLGISVPDTAKHAPCPGCGVVTDSALTTRTAGFVHLRARGAGTLAGDGFALVQHVRHCSAADALALVRDVVMPSSGGEPGRSARRMMSRRLRRTRKGHAGEAAGKARQGVQHRGLSQH